MNQDAIGQEAAPQPSRAWIAWVAGGAGAIVVLFVILFPSNKVQPSAARVGPSDRTQESGVVAARTALTKANDLNTCRGVLSQINTATASDAEMRPPTLKPADAANLRAACGLEEGELDEITGANYTALDGRHLAWCLLTRDVAQFIQGPLLGRKGARPEPVELARLAFDWVVRQVRLQQGSMATPDLALRRGWGTEMDRALIFLSLLRELGRVTGGPAKLVGCLVSYQGPDGKPRLWACGVASGKGHDLYLFEPRLGMALPGPGGSGVATLEQARSRPDVLKQLDSPDGPRYDVTAEKAKQAKIYLFCPLSSVSPRMRHLQEVLLPPDVEVRLAVDLAEEKTRLAAASAVKPDDVAVLPEGIGLWRQFYTPDEGGVAKPERAPVPEGFVQANERGTMTVPPARRAMLEIVPWSLFPPPVRALPYGVGMGQRVRDTFAGPFLRNVTEGSPRDQALHGHFRQAASDLVQEREIWGQERQRVERYGPDLGQHLGAWIDRATAVYADQVRAHTPEEKERADKAVAEIWKHAEPVQALIHAAMAVPRYAEVTYQLAQCKHEQAERAQSRQDALAQPAPAPEAVVEEARRAWQDALGWWTRFLQEQPGRPEAPTARRLQARALAALGKKEEAAKAFKDLSGPMTDLEKIAALYQARTLGSAGGK